MLLDNVPELKPMYDGHIYDNGELLPHVFFGEVTRYVVQHVRVGETGRSQPVGRILAFLEESMSSCDGQIRELVSASFAENLLGENDVIATLKGIVGPSLAKEIESCRN
jgi:hypothetical protein